jgi:SPOR domain
MSEYDRGRYSPGYEPPLAFEGRRVARAGGPAPVTLILSLLLLIAVGGGVFYIYRGGIRGPGDAPRPVGAPVGDVRTAAPPQVQTPDPAAGLSIYKDDPNAAPAQPAFVPPPEQPTPRPGTAPAPSTLATAAPSGLVKAAPAPAPPAAPAKAATPPAKSAKAVATPDVKPAAAKASGPAKAASIDTVLATTAPAAAKSGPPMVQIGAFSSQDLADAGWNGAAGLAPGDMAGKGKRIVPLTKADGSTLYRTSITGFASRDEAVALCAKLKAAGQVCLVK